MLTGESETSSKNENRKSYRLAIFVAKALHHPAETLDHVAAIHHPAEALLHDFGSHALAGEDFEQ